ncbi:MAG: hypothetical protein BJBARM4_0832 [Candidatus Parvarchaeum acidiphilum ARMAN-4]|uniref:ATPase n=1 Tax=Candidatus Parvarchaeum acidiphilum ARMAN-4 TaxID=662760 RepID=D2EGD3_PARA4|nr:MAG: hypothetical protein BJBARM4_0832 [Candidatus Parvarchaeum acidiphilum ARMAN-4]
MDVELLKVIIEEQREKIEKLVRNENIIERELKVSGLIKNPNSLVILGVRRAGKSILSIQTFNAFYSN